MIDEKYIPLLDKEITNFISLIDNHSLNSELKNVTQLRHLYDKFCNSFNTSKHLELEISTMLIKICQQQIPVRTYVCNSFSPYQILFVHGGGFIMGGLESHDAICSDICLFSGIDVTAVDYRLAPEHPFPAALEDVKAIYSTLKNKKETIAIGDSAGATIVAMLADELKTSNFPVSGQILVYPFLGGNMSLGSFLEHANAPGLTTRDLKFYLDCWMPQENHKKRLPLRRKDFSKLPPTIVIAAKNDPVYSDGFEYANKIRKFGGKALHLHGEGLVHGFLRARNMSTVSMRYFFKIIKACHLISAKKWPR